MPTVGDLGRLRKSALYGDCIAATSIPRHDADLGLPGHPGFGGRRLAIGQERDRSATFKITNEGSVAVVPLPGPVVDAND